MIVRLPPVKADTLVQLCFQAIGVSSVCIRYPAQLFGKYVSSTLGVLYAPLYYKRLAIENDRALKLSR